MTSPALPDMEVVPFNYGGLKAPLYVFNAVLAAGTAQAYTVPAGAVWVVFGSTGTFYAAYGSSPTAVVPSGNITDGTGNEINPTIRFLSTTIAEISLIAPANCVVSMAFYAP